MKKLLPILACLAALCAARAGNYQNFGVAVYIPVSVVKTFADPKVLQSEWDLINSQVKVDKVYIESYRGGTLAVAGIYLTDIPSLNYDTHLFQERTLRSVTSNTRGDGEEFLHLAERLRLQVTVNPYPFDKADQAVADLAAERFTGAAVISM